jgi:hypothetical protein
MKILITYEGSSHKAYDISTFEKKKAIFVQLAEERSSLNSVDYTEPSFKRKEIYKFPDELQQYANLIWDQYDRFLESFKKTENF